MKKKLTLLLVMALTFFAINLQAQQHTPRNQRFFKKSLQQKQSFAARGSASKPVAARIISENDSVGFGGVPGFVWEREVKKIFPGSRYGIANDVRKLSDGNYAATGVVQDSSPSFNQDMFFIKFTENGTILWKRLIDESPEELASNYIFPTPDGGFFTVGDGLLEKNGNTQMLKFNTNGDTAWRRYAPDSVWVNNAIVNSDGTILLIGDKESPYTIKSGYCIGKTYSYSGTVVIFKIDVNGNILWQKEIPVAPGVNQMGVDLRSTSNGNRLTIVGGYFSENHPDSCEYSNYFQEDEDSNQAFVLQTDMNGNLIWKKNFGGSKADCFTDIVYQGNFTYKIFGASSSIDGDLTGLRSDSLHEQAWVVSINDTGKILSQKVIASINNMPSSGFFHATLLPDSTICSNLISYKTDSVGNYSWESEKVELVKFDRNDNVVWRISSKQKQFYAFAPTASEDLITATYYYDEVTDEEKGWIGKLGPVSQISGSVFYDLNKNGLKDSDEPYCKNFQAVTEKANYSRSSFSQNGWFRNDVDTGTYITKIILNEPYYTVVPASKQTTFATLGLSDTVHFALQPIAGKQDLSVSITPLTAARPGFNASYKIKCSNVGTTTISNVKLKFVKDARTTFVAGAPSPSQTGDTVSWNISSFAPLADSGFTVELKLSSPPALNNGDTLKYNAYISPVTGDLTPADDTATIKQFVTGSYDPNDKSENFVGQMPQARYALGDDIQYFIRFQNTGTDTAFNIHITDTLDTNLDWTTLQMTSSSHKYKMTVKDGNKINWMFDNINLPDSNVNEASSHGFIAFKIKPKANLTAGDYISNKAFIYFDYNTPVVTNTVRTTIVSNRTTAVNFVENNELKITIFPNPAKDVMYLQAGGKLTGKFNLSVIDNGGKVIATQTVVHNAATDLLRVPVNLWQLKPGMYYIQLEQKGKKWVQKILLQ